MESAAAAPAKVILFGEHFVLYGTGALLCAIDTMARVWTKTLDADTLEIESAVGSCSTQLSGGAVPDELLSLSHIARKTAERFGHEGGMRILVESEIPPGAGLGSSSACCVAAAHAAAGLFSDPAKDEVFEASLQAERVAFAGASGADNAASTYGGIVQYDAKSGFENLQAPKGMSIVVADSGMQRSTTKIVSGVGRFRADNADRFAELCKDQSDMLPRARSAVLRGDLAEIGLCMRENQSRLEAIGVSNTALEEMVGIADRYGYGSKVTGAGGGGCIISAVPPERQNEAVGALSEAGYKSRIVRVDHSGVRRVRN